MMEHNVSLKPLNSFGIDVKARLFTSFHSLQGLQEILQESLVQESPMLILGGGSNILFTKDYDGLVLKNEILGIDQLQEDDDHIWIRVGAGENWHQFVMYCIKNQLAGVENLSLIPGCAGASPMQNIGAYGVEIKDVFDSLEAVHIKEHSPFIFNKEDCDFGYRESVFKGKYKGQFVITHVIFKLNKKPVYHTSYGAIEQELERMGVQDLSIKAVSDAVIHIRQSKLPDPAVVGNGGSFFKNPTIPAVQYFALKEKFPDIPGYDVHANSTQTNNKSQRSTVNNQKFKVPAGWMIEQCGWKGYRKGDAGVHPRQALVLVNYAHANGQEIYQLSSEVKQSVMEKFGIELDREVNII